MDTRSDNDLIEAQRSRARLQYKFAAACHAEAEALSEIYPTRAASLANRSREHRDLARETMRVLARLNAEWGAELEEIVAVHDLTFASSLTQGSKADGKE